MKDDSLIERERRHGPAGRPAETLHVVEDSLTKPPLPGRALPPTSA